MNRLLSILVFLFLVLSGHAQQTYNDALIFDAKGDVACIEYISQEDGNTSNMSINFNRDGSLENIVFSVETEDGFAFKQTQKIEEIQRDEFEQPIAITFKSFVLSKFVVNITWINNVAKEFQYNLVYNTKYVKEVGDDGLTDLL